MSERPPDACPPPNSETLNLPSLPPPAQPEDIPPSLTPEALETRPLEILTQETVPGHVIEKELGRGGMGVVYRARQVKLNRAVALKMILHAEHAGEEERRRFLNEAQALARLQHPHIVGVYEVGEHQGKPFFSLEYVEGGSLDKHLAGTPLPAREAARLVEQLADAIQAAHQAGIIHRDLKPANVLLAVSRVPPSSASAVGTLAGSSWFNDAVPKVTDFGLARKVGEAGQTQSGAIVGTPSYMAPEQAAGKTKEIDARTDVYALGAILYECLTGRPPFKAATAMDTLLQVLAEEPVPVRRLQPGVPRDLETVCHKCLQKGPLKRYANAAALGEDLRRFLAGEPIQARRVPPWERAAKWAKRRPALAGLLSVTALALLSLISVWIRFTAQLQTEKSNAQTERNEAVKQERLAQENQRIAEDRLVGMRVANGVRLMDEGDLFGALPWFVLALEGERGGPKREEIHRRRLGAVLQQCPKLVQLWVHENPVTYAVFSSDGRHVLAAGGKPFERFGRASEAAVWDVASGRAVSPPLKRNLVGASPRKPMVETSHAVFSPDGRFAVAVTRDQTVQILEVAGGRPVTPPLEHSGPVHRAAFSPDGRRLVTTTEFEARVWDAGSGKPLTLPMKHDTGLLLAAFSPDGRHIVTAGPLQARVWEVASGRPVTAILKHTGVVHCAAFSPDGRRLVTARSGPVNFLPKGSLGRTSSDTYFHLPGPGEALVWDVASGQAVTPPLKHDAGVTLAAFSPDGRRIVTASNDGTARVWDADNGQAVCPPLKHQAHVGHAAFSADGRHVVTTSNDGTARIWDAVSGRPLSPPLKHNNKVSHAAFSPDGRHVVTTSADRLVRVWDTAIGQLVNPPLFEYNQTAPMAATLSPDGSRVVTASHGEVAQVCDRARLRPAFAPLKHEKFVGYAGFSPDGRRIVTGSWDLTARVWDAASGQPVSPPLKHKGIVGHAAFSPDGRQVVTASGAAQVWEVVTGRPVTPPLKHNAKRVAFSPDGRRIITAGHDGTARIWDVSTGQLACPPLKHKDNVWLAAASFSPDGRSVVTASFDGSARVWDATSGRPVTPPLRHDDQVALAAFSPDGRHVVTASKDGTARVWDAASGRPISPPLKHTGMVGYAAFSPDGQYVVTTSWDQTARVWEAASGQPVCPPLRHTGFVEHAVFSSDGRRVITVSVSPDTRWRGWVWDLSVDEKPLADLRLLSQLLTGQQMDAEGGVVRLDPNALNVTWKTLRERCPQEFAPSPAQVLAWHLGEGNGCDEARQWHAALGHLDYLIRAEPADEKLRFHRARAHAQLRQWDSAAADLAKSLELGMDGPDVFNLRGYVFAQKGQWGEAVADYSKAIYLKAQGAWVWEVRAFAYGQLNQWDKAAADYSRALELKRKDPDVWKVWRSRGWAYHELGQWDKAIADYSQAIALKPDDWRSWW